MTAVQLRDIVTDADKAAVLGLRMKPGQERYLVLPLAVLVVSEVVVRRRRGPSAPVSA